MMRDISKEFQKIDAESLRKDFLAYRGQFPRRSPRR